MKQIAKILLCGLLILPAITVFGQAGKFGHINSQELLSQMPESDSAQAKIERLTREYQVQLEEMNVELNKKYDEYLNKRETYTDLIRQTKEADITEMQQRIQAFEQNAQMDLQNKQQEWLRPIIDKANAAVRKVAEDNGFFYIFDISRGNPVYWSDQSEDVLPLVKKQLGI